MTGCKLLSVFAQIDYAHVLRPTNPDGNDYPGSPPPWAASIPGFISARVTTRAWARRRADRDPVLPTGPRAAGSRLQSPRFFFGQKCRYLSRRSGTIPPTHIHLPQILTSYTVKYVCRCTCLADIILLCGRCFWQQGYPLIPQTPYLGSLHFLRV